MAQLVKNLPAGVRDAGSVPGSGRSPREGNGNPLEYSCLGNPVDRGAWRATVHGVAKELDTTERLSMHVTPTSHCPQSLAATNLSVSVILSFVIEGVI